MYIKIKMPILTLESFPTQTKSNYRVITEFLNVSKVHLNSIWKKFIFSNHFFIFATIRLNRIVIFLKYLKTFALCCIVRNDSSMISVMQISNSGSKFSFVIKQKIIIIFRLLKKNMNFSKKCQNFFFTKRLEFSCESQKSINLISSCFNNDEDRIFLSFSNGKILFLNFNGEIFSILKMENPIFNINPGIGISSNLEFFGLVDKEFLLNYNLINKKLRYFKSSLIYIIKKDSVFSLENNTLNISCTCHGKILKILPISVLIKKILLIENNKLVIMGEKFLMQLEFKNFLLKSTKIYHFEKKSNQEKLLKFNNQFYESNSQCAFLLIFSTKSYCIEIKPLDEKIKFLVTSNTFITKNNKINAIRFFGRKNSIMIGNDSNSIKIFNGDSFRLIGTFYDEDMKPNEIIIKGKILLILSNFNEILILSLPFLISLEKIHFSYKITIDFFIKKEIYLRHQLICGSESGKIKTWNLIFTSYTKTFLKLFWNQKIIQNIIISISISMDGKIIAALTKKNGIYLLELKNEKPINKLESIEKKLCCIKFCPKGKILVSGTQKGSIIFFNIAENSPSKLIKGDGPSVLAFDFNTKGSILVASYEDGTIKIISIYDLLRFRIFGNHCKPVWGCAISDDEQIITGCNGGQLTILRDITFENSKKQNKKFSRILFLKKSLKIRKKEKKQFGFCHIFNRLIFTKNTFMLMDFLEFSFKKNPKYISILFSKTIKFSHIHNLNFILKSLICWNHMKKKQIFVYKLVLSIFENLKFLTISKINFFILKGILKLIGEWILNIKHLENLFA